MEVIYICKEGDEEVVFCSGGDGDQDMGVVSHTCM